MVIILVNYGTLNFLLLKIQDSENLAVVLKAEILEVMIKSGNVIMDVFIVMLILTMKFMKKLF